MRTSRLFDALPPYLGGKRRLVPLILADLGAELPAAEWPGASFATRCAGAGRWRWRPRRRGSRSTPATARATVQTLAFRTLYVLIVIDHERRRIRHWNVTEHPNAPWIWRQMIEATAWGQQPGFLIRDRDRSYGGDFITRARRIGIETILTPVHAPNANAIAERVIGTLRRECLDHVIAVNEQHLRRVLGEYVQHYNAMRPHRSLSLDSPEGRLPAQRTPSQRVVSKPVLGGLHHEYRWAA